MRAVVAVAFCLIAAQGGYALATGDGLEMTLTVIVAALVAFMIYATLVRTNFGFNLELVTCPRCRVPLPRWRKPRNTRQLLWGGHTCHHCGIGVDKWGRPLAAR